MSKDPAMLFYTSDFLTGTMLMSHEQVGIYIRLLCIMHQHGGEIDLPAFDAYVGQNEIIRSKFIFEGNKVSNQRLIEEMAKRSKKSSSLSANALKRWENQCKSNAKASDRIMPIEDVNEDENVIDLKDKKQRKYVKDNPPSLEDVLKYCSSRNYGVDAQAFLDKNSSIGWIDKNGNLYQDWKAVIRTWESWRKATELKTAPVAAKRPIAIVVIEKIAAGKSNHDILHDLVGTYSEKDINEALMRAKGDFK